MWLLYELSSSYFSVLLSGKASELVENVHKKVNLDIFGIVLTYPELLSLSKSALKCYYSLYSVHFPVHPQILILKHIYHHFHLNHAALLHITFLSCIIWILQKKRLWTGSIKIPRTWEEDIGSHRVRVLFVFLPLALLVLGYISFMAAVLAEETSVQE